MMLRDTHHQDEETIAGLLEQSALRRAERERKRERILKLRRLDMKSGDIARQVKCSETTVNAILRSNGLEPFREPSVISPRSANRAKRLRSAG